MPRPNLSVGRCSKVTCLTQMSLSQRFWHVADQLTHQTDPRSTGHPTHPGCTRGAPGVRASLSPVSCLGAGVAAHRLRQALGGVHRHWHGGLLAVDTEGRRGRPGCLVLGTTCVTWRLLSTVYSVYLYSVHPQPILSFANERPHLKFPQRGPLV